MAQPDLGIPGKRGEGCSRIETQDSRKTCGYKHGIPVLSYEQLGTLPVHFSKGMPEAELIQVQVAVSEEGSFNDSGSPGSQDIRTADGPPETGADGEKVKTAPGIDVLAFRIKLLRVGPEEEMPLPGADDLPAVIKVI